MNEFFEQVELALTSVGGHLTRENVHHGNTRRDFTHEFKDEAVKLVINTGRPAATVAREFGVNEAALGRWMNLFKATKEAGATGITETEKSELLRLRKESAIKKPEQAILGKASLFFATEASDTNAKRSH